MPMYAGGTLTRKAASNNLKIKMRKYKIRKERKGSSLKHIPDLLDFGKEPSGKKCKEQKEYLEIYNILNYLQFIGYLILNGTENKNIKITTVKSAKH